MSLARGSGHFTAPLDDATNDQLVVAMKAVHPEARATRGCHPHHQAPLFLRGRHAKEEAVTFNGSSFDLPVLRYRAMTHSIAALGLSARPFFNRYTDDAIDLWDDLSSFTPTGKVTPHELCQVMGLLGKPIGRRRGEVQKYFREGRIQGIADYCESDVVNTYRVWLRYELFRGRVTNSAFEPSEASLK